MYVDTVLGSPPGTLVQHYQNSLQVNLSHLRPSFPSVPTIIYQDAVVTVCVEIPELCLNYQHLQNSRGTVVLVQLQLHTQLLWKIFAVWPKVCFGSRFTDLKFALVSLCKIH